jgi:membrane protease YdiL (CAAX protease family)
MSAVLAVDIAVYGIALAFGLFAITRWRRQGTSVRAGLGLTLGSGSVPDIAAGLVITTAAMVGILLVELWLGGIKVTRGPFDGWAALPIGLFLLLDGFIEELLMRGMLVSGLGIALGGRRIAAVLIAAVLFGMTHMFFEGASILSVISNSLGGVIYGLAFVLTGRLWLGVGLHFAWNFVQGPVLGFPVSGHTLGSGLLYIADLGPSWLTGIPYGPEGGVVGVAFRFVVIAAVFGWVRITDRSGRVEWASSGVSA